MDKKEIDSLIKLLDDSDNTVFETVFNKLKQAKTDIIPYLEKIWENATTKILQLRIENVIYEINKNNTELKLREWIEGKQHNLIEGATIVAQFQYPHIKYNEIKTNIDKIINDVWLEINDELTALEKIKIINKVFFDKYKYHSDTTIQKQNYNLFINNVLENKKGSAIILGIIYAGICQQLNINIYGVPLAKNFILCATNEKLSENNSNNILFYINPFNKGIVFDKKEIELFIKNENLKNDEKYYSAISNKYVIKELINNIILFYKTNNNETKAQEYRSILKKLYF
jgi:regulator of sirC expression with transglutaminase-like and TPR domain